MSKKLQVRKDDISLYIKAYGCIFRPLFTNGYDPRNPECNIIEGEVVRASYKGAGAVYATVKTETGTVLYWLNHGSYIIPHGDEVKHLKSNNVVRIG